MTLLTDSEKKFNVYPHNDPMVQIKQIGAKCIITFIKQLVNKKCIKNTNPKK